jgi:phospholipase C
MGGWVATEKFDHTSTLRLLELLTGVKVPNLTAWRRSTFGDLTSALGVASTASPPQLPDTKSQLEEAEKEVETLPAPKLPGKTQTPPKQETGSIPRPRV